MRNWVLASCVVLLTACPNPGGGGGGGGGGGTPPAVPANLAATYTTPNVSLTWSASSGATGYDLSRSTDGAATFTLLASVPKASFIDAGVTAGATYFYRVRATNADGTSSWSTPVSVTAGSNQGPDLTPPGDLTATPVSPTEVDLAWTDTATGEDGWVIERADGTGAFNQSVRIAANSTGAHDTFVVSGNTYSYRVHAVAGTTDGAFSNVVTVQVPTATGTAPAAPSGLTATAISASEIDVSWTDGSTNETGFDLERSTQPTSGFTSLQSLGANVTSFHDTTVAASTTFYYRVRASNAAGASAYSAVANATTPAPQVSPPATPTGLTVTETSTTGIGLGWIASQGALGYDVQRSQSASSGFTQVAQVSTTQFADAALTAGTTYYYRVRATNSGGPSGYTQPVSATTASLTTPPAAPTNGSWVALSPTSVRLDWTDVADNETGYELDVNPTRIRGTVATVPANTTTYTMTGLQPASTYFYAVLAYNAAGKSADLLFTVTTPSAPPTTQTTSLVPTYDNAMLYSTTNSNLQNTVYSNTELDVGCNWVYSGPPSYRQDSVCATSLLYFDTGAISGKTIIQATLTLSTKLPPGDWNSTLVIQGVSQGWNASTVTWSTAPQVYLSPESDQPPPYGSNPVVFDVTPIVQYWASGTRPNDGFLLENTAADYQYPLATVLRAVSFYSLEDYGGDVSLRPRLDITYQ